MRFRWSAVLILVCGASIVVALTAYTLGLRPYFLGGLWVASTAFVGVAVSAGLPNNREGWGLLAALMFCAFGDFVGPGNFELGVAAFALAHLAFTLAFCLRGVSPHRLPPMFVLVGAVDLLVLYGLLPHVEHGSKPLVLGYTAVISLMLATALALRPVRFRWLLVAAAVIFYTSDLFVARWRFVEGSTMNAYFCYPLYYTACLLFAYAAIRIRGGNPGGTTSS